MSLCLKFIGKLKLKLMDDPFTFICVTGGVISLIILFTCAACGVG